MLCRHQSHCCDWIGSSESETDRLTPDRQRGRMAGAKTPMETGGAKENRTYQESSDGADYRKRTAAGETVQFCLMPVHYDQYPKDQEADRFAQ